ncbi:hypothetical protein BOX15_Mlig029005g1 [Macrostomum lignano]|uniref:Deoxynucleoside kinase domain-containing protein n=1 Tax=Macrostomum lignano TaxID=282301 RepID=A0A267E6G8_9PLAT|nr:hypothetical protein BOX15_Mlig029005g1 [Macrostomum lignano]
MTRIYILEGNLAAGKTTLLRNLALNSRLEKWEPQILWAKEPVQAFTSHPKLPAETNPLEEFYRGSLSALGFQVHASHCLLQRDKNMRELLLSPEPDQPEYDILVMERVMASAHAFNSVLAEAGRLTTLEKAICCAQVETLQAIKPSEATLIYLDIDPSLALERIRQRGRTGESEVTLDYLNRLHEAMVSNFSLYRAVHRVTVGPSTTPSDVARLVGRIVRGLN